MNEERKEKMLNLLADKAIFGLNDFELAELEKLSQEFPKLANDASFEKAAAAFNVLNLETEEKLPANLSRKILADAENFFNRTEDKAEDYQKTFAVVPTFSIWNKLGWVIAALACLALLVNVWLTRISPSKEVGGVTPTPTVSPKSEPNFAEQREAFMKQSSDIVKADWADADPKNPIRMTGDVVWSNKEQKGFLRLRNFPVNDKTKETYQIWIFDANQDEKTPVDGGVFDVGETGEVIIPINAKLKVGKPLMFAITEEKPGGVVVSDRKHLMTIAKISA